MTKSRDSVFERPFGCDQIKETVSSSYVGSARPVPDERRGDGIVLVAEVRHLRPGSHRPKVARADLSARSLLALLEECNPDAGNDRAAYGGGREGLQDRGRGVVVPA